MRRALFIVLAGLFLAGCGGGGSSGSGAQPLSRQQYAAKADAICRKYTARTNTLGHPTTLAGLAKTFDRGLPLLTKELAELRGLTPPKSEQKTVDEWLAQSEVLEHDLQEMRDKARARDMKGVQAAFGQATSNGRHGNQIATKLGLKVCSKG